MKKLLLALILTILISIPASSIEIDTLWYRTMSAGARNVDFTPDDKYVIAWTNGIEFWEVQKGVMEFSVPTELLGDYNYNEEFLVFSKDSTPKLLNWKTREVEEGFRKEQHNLERIRTAKSKNEFMVKTYEKIDHVYTYKNKTVLYFFNIDDKSKVDSFAIINQFEKDGYKWNRRFLDFDYVGDDDEFIYVSYHDYNNLIETIPPPERLDNYFSHIYDRNTKELVDSLFLYQRTSKGEGTYINKMQVMNDRSKIAWNNKGGEINFYDIYTRKFYDQLVFDTHDFVEAFDIEFNRDESVVGITHGQNLKIYNLQKKEKIHDYFLGSWQNLSFSNNNDYLTTNIGSWLVLFPSHTGISSVEDTDNNRLNLTVTPNPASNNISIHFSSATNEPIKLSIIDLVGNEIGIIDEGNIENQNYSIDYNISNLAPATYFIRLELGSEIFTKKFIKE
ncbi:MAG: T9SS type A sorting domain-containing protein [Candidatus Kapaibacterium sp.]